MAASSTDGPGRVLPFRVIDGGRVGEHPVIPNLLHVSRELYAERRKAISEASGRPSPTDAAVVGAIIGGTEDIARLVAETRRRPGDRQDEILPAVATMISDLLVLAEAICRHDEEEA